MNDTNNNFLNRDLSYSEYLYSNDATDSNKQEVVAQEQISLGIEDKTNKNVYRIRRRLERMERLIEINPFWNNGLTVFTTVFILSISAIIGLLIVKYYGQLPFKIPFFYNHSDNTWDANYDKSFLLILPVIIMGFNLMITRLNMLIFRFDRKLVYFTSLSLIMVNLLLIISFIQLLYLTI